MEDLNFAFKMFMQQVIYEPEFWKKSVLYAVKYGTSVNSLLTCLRLVRRPWVRGNWQLKPGRDEGSGNSYLDTPTNLTPTTTTTTDKLPSTTTTVLWVTTSLTCCINNCCAGCLQISHVPRAMSRTQLTCGRLPQVTEVCEPKYVLTKASAGCDRCLVLPKERLQLTVQPESDRWNNTVSIVCEDCRTSYCHTPPKSFKLPGGEHNKFTELNTVFKEFTTALCQVKDELDLKQICLHQFWPSTHPCFLRETLPLHFQQNGWTL